MDTITVQNHDQFGAASGRSFTFRLVRKGEGYGRDRCLTHDDDRPMVEVYDSKFAGDPYCEAEGQTIAQYYVETLLGMDGRYGLDLHGGVSEWKVDNFAFGIVRVWLNSHMATR